MISQSPQLYSLSSLMEYAMLCREGANRYPEEIEDRLVERFLEVIKIQLGHSALVGASYRRDERIDYGFVHIETPYVVEVLDDGTFTSSDKHNLLQGFVSGLTIASFQANELQIENQVCSIKSGIYLDLSPTPIYESGPDPDFGWLVPLPEASLLFPTSFN